MTHPTDDLPTEYDALMHEYINVCEERDHLRALLAEQARTEPLMRNALERALAILDRAHQDILLDGLIPARGLIEARKLANAALATPLLKAEQAKDAAENARMTTAARDVLAERQRQVCAEGWTPEHDDDHRSGDMARAAASYAAQAGICGSWPARAYMASLPPLDDEERGKMMWPWNREWWKPKNPRADLVRAGALILAEIERMDRAARAAERSA